MGKHSVSGIGLIATEAVCGQVHCVGRYSYYVLERGNYQIHSPLINTSYYVSIHSILLYKVLHRYSSLQLASTFNMAAGKRKTVYKKPVLKLEVKFFFVMIDADRDILP